MSSRRFLAFEEGRNNARAHVLGKPNPYPLETVEWSAYEQGWLAGADEPPEKPPDLQELIDEPGCQFPVRRRRIHRNGMSSGGSLR
jgi:hypothetical protein